jgi:dihydrolipoamide dehydrogenase
MPEQYDLIVIGGGRASTLALAAAKAGWKTALIEKDKLGGTCPNRGCVPSKLLIGFAEAARHIRDAGRHFIDAQIRSIDTTQIFESVNSYVGAVDARYETRVRESGAELLRGEGRFVGVRVVGVEGRQLTAERIVVATGSRPAAPPFAHLPVWTSDNLFPLNDPPPRSLIVIGGGVIGCEMAAFFAALGTETRLFARGDRLLGKEDETIENVFQTEFAKEVPTECHSKLEDLQHENGEFRATFAIHGERREFRAERVLFAIGRVPNTEALDLDKTGLSVDAKGFVPVDDHLETCVPGIFATGDVNGRFMLQHAASFEVNYLRRRFLKNIDAPIDENLVGHAIFTHPEVAAVGKTEEQLKVAGTEYVAIVQDWLSSARAMAMRIEYPRTKLIVCPRTHKILGCHLVGPEASTLIHQVITVMHLKNDVRELARMIYVHPALSECLLSAAVKAVSEIAERSKA